MRRLIPVIALISALLFVFMTDEIIVYKNGETILMVVMVAMTGGIMLYLIRRPAEHNFVNGLPVTKKQQWKCLYLSLLTMAVLSYAMYIIITYIQCHNDVINFTEMLVSGIVKCATAIFVMTLLMWILGHIDFHLSKNFFVTLVMFFGGIGAIGTALQKAFNTKTNNFVYELKKYWCYMTVPIEHYETAKYDFGMYGFVGVSVKEKIILTAVYLFVIIGITVLLALCANINYSRITLEKNMNKGSVKRFPKVFLAIYLSVCFLGTLCRIVELRDFITTEIDTDYPVSYEEYEWDEILGGPDQCYAVYRDGKIFYEVIKYVSFSGNYLFKYVIYKTDFPKEYLYIFIVNSTISVVTGITMAVITDKKLKKEGVIK